MKKVENSFKDAFREGSASGLIKKYFAYYQAEFDAKLAENLIFMSAFSFSDKIPCKKFPNLENVE